MKYMSSGYPAYETLLFRCVATVPVILFMLWRAGRGWSIATPFLPRVLLRGVILAGAYLCFVLSLAAMPIANAVYKILYDGESARKTMAKLAEKLA